VFAVPGSSEKMIGKALDFQVDQLFLDLEDGVAPDAKAAARELINSAGQKKFTAPLVSIRVNALEWVAGLVQLFSPKFDMSTTSKFLVMR
jgi:citrate lyase subunit beta/citryl-CoA lyase